MSAFGIREDTETVYLSLDERFLKDQNSKFFVQMTDSAMAPFIMPGDEILYDGNSDKGLCNGSIVVIAIEEEDCFLVRRFYRNHTHIYLKADNPKFKTITLPLDANYEIRGIVQVIFRDLKNADSAG